MPCLKSKAFKTNDMQIPHSDAEKRERTKKKRLSFIFLMVAVVSAIIWKQTARADISLKRRAAIYTEIVKSFCVNKKTTDGMSLKIKS